jgi:hypothetical protein
MKSKIVLLIVSVLMLSACGKKSSGNNVRTGRNGTSNNFVGAPPNQGTGSTTCQQQQAWGRIFSQTMSSQQFTQQLITFTGNQEIGLVDSNYNSPTTGVDMQLSAVFSGNQFNPTQSRLLIRIIDSNSFTMGRLDDIALTGQSGQVIGNGAFQASYSDQYGTVTLQGQRDNANMIYGQITFQNTDGSSGQLGEFYVAGCSLAGI